MSNSGKMALQESTASRYLRGIYENDELGTNGREGKEEEAAGEDTP